MTPKQIVTLIEGMRDRDTLAQIIWAAEKRDNHLSTIESEDRRKRAWSKFSHLRKGDFVFIHKEPKEKQESYHFLYGTPLKVVEVKPKLRELVVATNSGRRAGLTALVALDLKLSEEPTSAAFANSLDTEDEQ